MNTRPDWDTYFSNIALAVSARADCRRRQVGAVIVDEDHRILATGYNGAPAHQPGCLAGACPRGLLSYEDVGALSAYDNCISIHAEANALLYARTSLVGATMYVTCEPCKDCAKLIAGSGIVVTIFPDLREQEYEKCQHINTKRFFTVPPHVKCLDCGKVISKEY